MGRPKKLGWTVVCQDRRMPTPEMNLAEAQWQADFCDEHFPDCGPHRVIRKEWRTA